MSDCKMKLVRNFQNALSYKLPADQNAMITEMLIKVLDDFEVSEACREIAVRDDGNERILKQYCACLYVDGKSEKTIYQYRNTCQKLSEALGKNFKEMGTYDLRYFLACEKERGLSNRSLENLRANISAFFQWMTKEDIIQKNPCMAINSIKYEDVIRKPFSDIEIDKLRMACKNGKERAVVELLLSSGIRVSELTALKVDDINMTDLSVHVKCGKGGKGRVTYTTPVALKHIGDYWNTRTEEGCMAFYNNKHQSMNPGGIRHMLKMLGSRAGVDNVHPHRFRRTFATGLATRGMDIQDIKSLLGHANIETTMEYVCIDSSKVSASYRQHIA